MSDGNREPDDVDTAASRPTGRGRRPTLDPVIDPLDREQFWEQAAAAARWRATLDPAVARQRAVSEAAIDDAFDGV